MERPEIPSEFIEPYLKDFFMTQIESIAYGLITPDDARIELKGVESFISQFGAIHSRFAVSNMYGNFRRLSDVEMIAICKRTYLVENEKQI